MATDFPKSIAEKAEKLFPLMILEKGKKLFRTSNYSISFYKGTPETYFIISGIIKDSNQFETKVVYKKRLEGTFEGPVSSKCNCTEWKENSHCPHVVCLYFGYFFKTGRFQEEGALAQTDNEDNLARPPIASFNHMGVSVEEYGTILSGPHKLIGAPPNSSYSSLQYLLHNQKIINFPIPIPFEGKIQVDIFDVERAVDGLEKVHFSYLSTDGEQFKEISLLENLYLFNWRKGETLHLPSSLKGFFQKFRIQGNSINLLEFLTLASSEENKEYFVLKIQGDSLDNFKVTSAFPHFYVGKKEKDNQLKVYLSFKDEFGNALPPPPFFQTLNFTNGLLESFKRKKDSYDFLYQFFLELNQEPNNYKSLLNLSSEKTRLIDILDRFQNNEKSVTYDIARKLVIPYDNHFVRTLFKALIESYTELFFRFATFNSQSFELQFKVHYNQMIKGISKFYYKLRPFGLHLTYGNQDIGKWGSKITFDRRKHNNKWFDLTFNISKEEIDLIKNADIENGHIVQGDKLILLEDQDVNLLKFLKKYVQYDATSKKTEGKKTTFLIPFNRSRIFELFELKNLGLHGALTPEEEQICQRLATLEEIPQYVPPKSIKEFARPYQITGYRWLRFLWENKLGACLADDMGLGKTFQAIAFLESIIDQIDRALIVCPVSILLNWNNEIEKFSNMAHYIYHGGNREFSHDHKIVLTSYGVMKREASNTLKDLKFDILVLDEVQHLKNMRTQGAIAARKIDADFRICLTGTPVENDLAEFYNILDLSLPGIWGDMSIIRSKSYKKSRLLARKMAKPFILRRTKDQVLNDLPPKIENNVYLNFSEKEKNNYVNLLLQIKDRIKLSSSRKKYGEILRGLLLLRQSCLWQQTTHAIQSTKIEFLIENLTQILEEGHQAIIFSQFTTYLDHIQTALSEKPWSFSRIDGSQNFKKRQQQVDLFQNHKNKIFLISLKAGGVGLNLTAASYVFLMDPWWNPAVEAQAIDRAYRIGQKNTLTVYRPIIKDSIEEKILHLQKNKKQLFYDLLPESGDQYFTGKLTMADFEGLFL